MTLEHVVATSELGPFPDHAQGTAHHVPRFHIRPPKGYLNDPNGPVVIGGRQHIYFQYRHTTDINAPVEWGHASSKDLAHWTLHRPAMAPDPIGLDQDGCWSGNTVLGRDGVLRAYYSGLRSHYPLQSVLVAESTDGGMSFGSPSQLVEDPDHDVVVYRDPFVWREPDGAWAMAVGAGDAAETASARLYISQDGLDWTFAGTLAALARTTIDGHDTGAMWECPQVADIDGVRVILVSACSEKTGTMRVHAVLPAQTADQAGGLGFHLIDQGPDFYAASVQREGPAGPIVWGWVQEARTPSWWQEAGWAGAISLPRIPAMGPGGRVLSYPHPALSLLRAETSTASGRAIAIGSQTELEIRTPLHDTTLSITFGDEELLLVFAADGRIHVDRSTASRDPRADADSIVVEGAAGPIGFDLRLFVDGSVFELFTATGQVATFRCYPLTPPPWKVQSSDENTIITAHRLQP